MNISAVYQFDPGKAITINGRNTGVASCDPTLILLCKTIAKDIVERKLGNRLTVQVTRKKLSPAEYYCSALTCLRTPMNESIAEIKDRLYNWVYTRMNEPSNDPCIKVDFILMNEYDSIDEDVDIYYLHDGDIEDDEYDEDDEWDDEEDDDPAEEPDMERLDILFKEACGTCKELITATTIPPDGSKLRNIMRVIRNHDNDVMAVIQAMIEELKIMQDHEDHLVHTIANRLNAMDHRFSAIDRVINNLNNRFDDIEDTIAETEDD